MVLLLLLWLIISQSSLTILKKEKEKPYREVKRKDEFKDRKRKQRWRIQPDQDRQVRQMQAADLRVQVCGCTGICLFSSISLSYCSSSLHYQFLWFSTHSPLGLPAPGIPVPSHSKLTWLSACGWVTKRRWWQLQDVSTQIIRGPKGTDPSLSKQSSHVPLLSSHLSPEHIPIFLPEPPSITSKISYIQIPQFYVLCPLTEKSDLTRAICS